MVIVDSLDLRGGIDQDRGAGSGRRTDVRHDAAIVISGIPRIVVQVIQ